jgi:lambda family phage portal protein
MNQTLRLPSGRTVTVNENLLDRVVRWFDPIQGARRFRARALSAIVGGYTGASRSRRSMQQWQTRGNDPDTDILFDLPTLRERSRDLIRNEPIATGAVAGVVTNVVGSGLRMQSRIDRAALAMSDAEADAWESNTEREWQLFSESQECDAARTLNFYGIQDLVFRSVLESGDCFVLTPMFRRPGSPYQTRLQVIEADRVSNKDNKIDSETMAGGVERDSNGAPTAYHILTRHPGSLLPIKREWNTIPAFGAKTGRRNVIHLFRMLRPGQTRGVPYLAPVIEMIKQLGRYSQAEVDAAVISSFFTVFVKSETGEMFGPMGPTSETGASTSDEDIKLASGAVVGLAPGESIETADPKRPNTAFDPFMVAVLRQIGVALEIPFEVLVKHFTASYSAARAALLEAWKFFNSRRQWLADNFCKSVYEIWMMEAVVTGRIKAPGFLSDPLLRKAYLGSEWVGPARGMINEVNEVDAAVTRINEGLSTRDKETAELTGGDWETNHRQLVKEKRMRQTDGLEPKDMLGAKTPKQLDPSLTQ